MIVPCSDVRDSQQTFDEHWQAAAKWPAPVLIIAAAHLVELLTCSELAKLVGAHRVHMARLTQEQRVIHTAADFFDGGWKFQSGGQQSRLLLIKRFTLLVHVTITIIGRRPHTHNPET